MVVITVNFEVKPDKVAEFQELISGHSKRTLEREPGCRQFDVSQDPKNAQKFFLYEVYDNEAAFEAHPLGGQAMGETSIATLRLIGAGYIEPVHDPLRVRLPGRISLEDQRIVPRHHLFR